jgi:hypothetical protein
MFPIRQVKQDRQRGLQGFVQQIARGVIQNHRPDDAPDTG